MERKIGVCSICGGDVVHHEGVWHATIPPPPPHCVNCGAVSADSQRVIPMVRPRGRLSWYPPVEPANGDWMIGYYEEMLSRVLGGAL